MMIKKLLLLPLLAATVSAHAVPNIWRAGFGMGFSEYSIEDSKGRELLIACNVSATPDFDNSVYFKVNDNLYENSDSKYPLTFLIDDTTEVAPPGTTNWRNGANAWNEFIENISKAKKIDVYLNNKHITTYKPNVNSLKKVASEMSECEAMLYKDWEDW